MASDFDSFLSSKKNPTPDETKQSWNSIASELATICKDRSHKGHEFISKNGSSVMSLDEVQARFALRNQQYYISFEMRELTPMEQWSIEPLRAIVWELKPKYSSKGSSVEWVVDEGAALTATECTNKIAEMLVEFYDGWEDHKQTSESDSENEY